MLATNEVVEWEKFGGKGLYLPAIILYASWWSDWALKGGCRAAISYSKTPSDQISDLKL